MSMKKSSIFSCIFLFFAWTLTANSSPIPIPTNSVSDLPSALEVIKIEHETIKSDAFEEDYKITPESLRKSLIFSPTIPNNSESGVEKPVQDLSTNKVNFNVTTNFNDDDYNTTQQDVWVEEQQGSNIGYEKASRDISEFLKDHRAIKRGDRSKTNTIKPNFEVMSQQPDWQFDSQELRFLFKDPTSSVSVSTSSSTADKKLFWI